MMSDIKLQSMIGSPDYGDELGMELGALLREQRRKDSGDPESEMNLNRSGSAPPTVSGSLTAVGGFFGSTMSSFEFDGGVSGKSVLTEEELRSDPAYISYYYSNVNLNPRLPPPLLSREDWRFAQRFKGSGAGSVLGGIGDRRKTMNRDDAGSSNNLSLFSSQPGIDDLKLESRAKASGDWGEDGLIGLPALGLGGRKKSIAEIIQDDLKQKACPPRYSSRPVSRNLSNIETYENHHFSNSFNSAVSSADRLVSPGDNGGSSAAVSAHPFASPLDPPLSRSHTPDPLHLPQSAISPTIPDKKTIDNPLTTNLSGAFSSMKIHKNGSLPSMSELNFLEDSNLTKKATIGKSSTAMEDPIEENLQQQRTPNAHRGIHSLSRSLSSNNAQYRNWDSSNSFSSYGPGDYTSLLGNQLGVSNLPPLYENAAASALGATAIDSMLLGGSFLPAAANHSGGISFVDPLYLQYLRSAEYTATQRGGGYIPSYDMGGVFSPPSSPFNGSSYKSGGGYYGLSHHHHHQQQHSPQRAGSSSLRNNHFMRSLSGTGMGATMWHSEIPDDRFALSLLDEFKSNKTKCFELSEIADHVVEFSADQYGSRFIQQKLETARSEERDMVFHEIMPHALSLMTDVFGNYVVQKFFEHGSASQVRDLAEQLAGHVLALSLQMYGCRVIQKAIEVAELDQQTQMVAELEGHVMRCVRDQNGNHVIQKCIECIPEDAIRFIVSTFYDQVVTLSTHPYGCRVIQRVLEHCRDQQTQGVMMGEILRSVCMLTQDQYGNYVVQHVLEHGKVHERSAIIKKLTGKIVQMSQQKFASNVIEKCLSFGDPFERRLLVNEMLGSTDENEPLQAMMKDQFGNYVVQKVLETCDDQQLELILNRIKVHLTALKKYTYGKHIVARVEKLVAAGERRISVLSLHAA